MHWQHTPFLFPLFTAALVSAALGVLAWRNRSLPTAAAFAAIMGASAWWSFFYALYQAGATLWQKQLFAAVLQAGAIAMPLTWLVFAARYTHREAWVARRRLALLFAVPLFTFALVLTNGAHGWFWSRFDLVERSGRAVVDSANGWGFWLHVGYSWVVMSAAVLMLVVEVARSTRMYRGQAAALLLGALVPWIGNILHISRIVRAPANPMPFLFTLSGVFFAWAVFRYRLLDVLPVARERVIDEMGDGVVVVDREGRLVDLNPAARRILKVGGAAVVGRRADEVIGAWARLPASTEGGEPALVETDDGGAARKSYDVRVTPFHDRGGVDAGRVVVLRDVTERARMEERLRRSAFYDPLTGLANRALFQDRIGASVERARRGRHPFALLFLDLDRFKVVNDSLGHHVGDELLVAIARRLESCVRPGDTVARLGGDEFAVLLEEVRGQDEAVQVAERIRGVVGLPVDLAGHDVVPSVSIGVVMGAELDARAEALLRYADVAMYRAKAAGRGTYEVFDPAMHDDAVERLRLESDLRHAAARGELRLLWQPIVELATGRTAGMEALLRWHHPSRGVLRPGAFLRVAEETGIILEVGAWVAEAAVRRLAAWQRQFSAATPPLVASVNVSPRELGDAAYVPRVEALLAEVSPAPDTFRVEVTESAIMRNTEAIISVLSRLEALGVRCFMDDFGTGYSSLRHLHRLPVNVMKVDRTFVERIPAEREAVEVVRTIASLASTLGLDLVAEGVETPEQEALLRTLGCRYAQGFLFSPPLSEEDATRHLEARFGAPD